MPECFEAFDQATGRSNGVAFVVVVGTQVLVGGGPLQHVVASGKDGIGDGDERTLRTAQCS